MKIMNISQSPSNKTSLSQIICVIMIVILGISAFGIYILSQSFLSPFQKIFYNTSVSKVQNGGSRNTYLEMSLRPELRLDTDKLIQNIVITPDAKFSANYKDGSIVVDLGTAITPDTAYTMSFKKETGLKTLDNFGYSFRSPKPMLAYLSEKNTVNSAIVKKEVGGAEENIIKKSFILDYSMTLDYVIYSYRDSADYASRAQIGVYNIADKSTSILPGRYDQFFELITEEQSNQAIIGKEDSSYALLDLASLTIKPLTGIDGKYSTFLSFASPQYVVYNTSSFANNTILFDLNTLTGTLIGKFTKVIAVDNKSGNICLSSLNNPDKIYTYSADGKTTEVSIPIESIDDIVSSRDCQKIVVKNLNISDSLSFNVSALDSKSMIPELIKTQNSVSIGEFVTDQSTRYFGYSLVEGIGAGSYNNFVLYDRKAGKDTKVVESIKNISQVLVY